MTNIPTELLRTLIAVVDLRSFTKAAQSLGVTQPAVSAQIKRLQCLLGSDLFDKSAPGVLLTEKGELVVNYARRLLAINDQILELARPQASPPPLRIGIPGDFGGKALPAAAAAFQAKAPHLRLQVRAGESENLLRDLRQGRLDLVFAMTTAGPALDARHCWTEEVVWARGVHSRAHLEERVPLVTMNEETVLHRLALSTLNQAGRSYDVVFLALSSTGVAAAVSAGLGVSLFSRRRLFEGLVACEDGPLPRPAPMYCGVYVRESTGNGEIEELADAIAAAVRPPEGHADRAQPLNAAVAGG